MVKGRVRPRGYGDEGLGRFRYHTGATVSPLDPEEPCPILFRDIGMDGAELFLRSALSRLGGPLAPVVWMRSERWREPYTDHGRVGRIVLLQPLEARPWKAGVPHCYVAPIDAVVPEETLGFLPGGAPDPLLAGRIRDCVTVSEMREALGGRDYDTALDETRTRVRVLRDELARTEGKASSLRASLQRGDPRARDEMAELGVDETDLCSAWNHLPDERRLHLLRVFG